MKRFPWNDLAWAVSGTVLVLCIFAGMMSLLGIHSIFL
ncbi:hypothetical protein ALPO108162_14515 [Alicyclobacillus pomorum]